ncbi:MAG: RNA polymerase sigma factor [Chloroflexi bacterium]|nr:MAG: RNA polymerase sigma factor [Chloroflexota bacterium]
MVPGSISAERWEQLYRLEFARVYRALLAVLRDPDRALDALQDAFVAGLRRPPAEDLDLAGWLFVVAIRSGRRGLGRKLLGLDHARSQISKDEIKASLDRIEVGRLLAGLSERQRAMVVAQFYLGLDHREIARHFGVKTGTVSATLAQAKARMRTEVRNAS